MTEITGTICANPNPPCAQFSAVAVRTQAGTHPIPHSIAQDYVQHGPQLYAGRHVTLALCEKGDVAFVRTAPRVEHACPHMV